MVVMIGIDEPPERAGLRQLPRLVRDAIRDRLDRRPYDLLLPTALQFVGGIGIVALLLLGRRPWTRCCGRSTRPARADVLPWVLGDGPGRRRPRPSPARSSGSASRCSGSSSAATSRAACSTWWPAVDLATFDDPEFHNRVQRMQDGDHQALQMVYGCPA